MKPVSLNGMADADRLLTMLDGCPDGCTQHLLINVHNFAPNLIYRCVERSLIEPREQLVGARRGHSGWRIFRFFITQAGREALINA